MSDIRHLLDDCVEALRGGDLARAEALCRRILDRVPGHPDGLHLHGCVRLGQGRASEAVRLIGSALERAPFVPLYHENLAEALFHARDLAAAESEARIALRLDGGLHRARNLLGLIAMERGDHEAACRHLLEALEAKRPYLEALLNLAVVMNRTGEHEQARDFSRLALRLAPGHPLALTNLGMAHLGARDLDAAKQAFAAAGDFPKARFNLGFTRMLEDDLAGGLPLLEERKALLGIGKGMQHPEWDGSPMPHGHLLVLHEQGLGDTILMARFLPALCDLAAQVTVVVQPPLARLIATLDPRLEVVTATEGVACDRWVAMMSLPLRLGVTDARDIPLAPWIRAEASAPAGEKPRVGINWAGNPRYAFDAIRSTHLEKLALLLGIGDVEWVSLHKGHLECEAEAHGLPQPLREAEDFLDTARVVAGCDLVVSTETALPNLSAAMGVPTCVLTSPNPDWRWSAWYPCVTLCRQAVPGDWNTPMVQVLGALRDLLAARAAA
jgi:hypothetical protein